jgi:hypothetical protein
VRQPWPPCRNLPRDIPHHLLASVASTLLSSPSAPYSSQQKTQAPCQLPTFNANKPQKQRDLPDLELTMCRHCTVLPHNGSTPPLKSMRQILLLPLSKGCGNSGATWRCLCDTVTGWGWDSNSGRRGGWRRLLGALLL